MREVVGLSMQNRSVSAHGLLGIEDRRQESPKSTSSNRQASSAAPSVSATTAAKRSPDKPDDIVEDVGIVGLDPVIVMRTRAERQPRHVFPGEDREPRPAPPAPFPGGWP